MPYYKQWNDVFGRQPPLELMIGHYLGYRQPEEKPKPASLEDHGRDLIQAFQGVLG